MSRGVKKRKVHEQQHPFDTGYAVYKGAVCEETLRSWVESMVAGKYEFHSIFNHTGFDVEGDTEKRRQQAFLAPSLTQRLFGKFQQDHFPNLKLADAVLLLSLPGCKQQMFHADYVVTKKLMAVPKEHYPMGVLLALEDNTRLVMREGAFGVHYDACDTNIVEVTLNVGDALVFRADQIHAGAAYDECNMRVHAFLDSPIHRRPANQTFILEYDE
jgi:hypothetical protein